MIVSVSIAIVVWMVFMVRLSVVVDQVSWSSSRSRRSCKWFGCDVPVFRVLSRHQLVSRVTSILCRNWTAGWLLHGRVSWETIAVTIVFNDSLRFPRRRSSSRVGCVWKSWSNCRNKEVRVEKREPLPCLTLLWKVWFDSSIRSLARKCRVSKVVRVSYRSRTRLNRCDWLRVRDSQVIQSRLDFLKNAVVSTAIVDDWVDIITGFDVGSILGLNFPIYFGITRQKMQEGKKEWNMRRRTSHSRILTESSNEEFWEK